MCTDCSQAHNCGGLPIAMRYQSLYPNYFEEERGLRMLHDVSVSDPQTCEQLEPELQKWRISGYNKLYKIWIFVKFCFNFEIF